MAAWSLTRQTSTVGPHSGGFTARISMINPRTGAGTMIVNHLPAMTFDEEGTLLISNTGFEQPSNTTGVVVKVGLGVEDDD